MGTKSWVKCKIVKNLQQMKMLTELTQCNHYQKLGVRPGPSMKPIANSDISYCMAQNRTHDRNNLREEGFILAQGFRSYCPSH